MKVLRSSPLAHGLERRAFGATNDGGDPRVRDHTAGNQHPRASYVPEALAPPQQHPTINIAGAFSVRSAIHMPRQWIERCAPGQRGDRRAARILRQPQEGQADRRAPMVRARMEGQPHCAIHRSAGAQSTGRRGPAYRAPRE